MSSGLQLQQKPLGGWAGGLSWGMLGQLRQSSALGLDGMGVGGVEASGQLQHNRYSWGGCGGGGASGQMAAQQVAFGVGWH